MYTGRGDKFWARHPLLALMFMLAWSAAVMLWAIGVAYRGTFRWGQGVNAEPVTREAHPVWLWITVVVAVVVSAIGFAIGVSEFRSHRRRQR